MICVRVVLQCNNSSAPGWKLDPHVSWQWRLLATSCLVTGGAWGADLAFLRAAAKANHNVKVLFSTQWRRVALDITLF